MAAYEDEFVKIVIDEQYKQIQLQQKKNKESLQEALAKPGEIDVLYERIYEEHILSNLTDDRYRFSRVCGQQHSDIYKKQRGLYDDLFCVHG